jgi:prefoldin subunit 5
MNLTAITVANGIPTVGNGNVSTIDALMNGNTVADLCVVGTSINTTANSILTTLGVVNTTINAISTAVISVNSQLTVVNTTINSIATAVNTLTTNNFNALSSINTATIAISTALGVVNTTANAISTAVNTLTTNSFNALSSINTTATSISSAVVSVNTQLTVVNTTINSVATAVTSVNTTANGILTTLGAKTDAANTYTNTTSISAMAVLKQISTSTQALVTGGITASISALEIGNSSVTAMVSNVYPTLATPALVVSLSPNSNTVLGASLTGGLATGANVIGSVAISSGLPTGANLIGNVSISVLPALAAGTNLIGIVNIANNADAANTYTNTTPISAMAVLKQISNSVQSSIPTGTNVIGTVSIGNSEFIAGVVGSSSPLTATPSLVVSLSPNSNASVGLSGGIPTGANVIGNVLIGNSSVQAAIKAASTAAVAADPAIVVTLSPNGINPNGQANMAQSAPVVIANNQTAIPVSIVTGANLIGNVSISVLPSIPAGTNLIGIVNIANNADAANTYTNTTPISAMAVLKQISNSTQSLVSGGLSATISGGLATGANLIGNVSISVLPSIPAGTNLIGIVNIANNADAANTYTNTTPISAMAVLKQISSSAQNLVSGGLTATISGGLATGANLIGNVSISVLPALPAGTNLIGIVNIANNADAANTYTNTTAISAMAVLKQISSSVQSSIPAGTNLIGNVSISVLPSIPAGSALIGNVSISVLPSIPAGSALIGNVSISVLPSIPAGTNLIGIVNIANNADAANTYTNTTSISAMAVLKQISSSAQNLVSGGLTATISGGLATGANVIGNVLIGNSSVQAAIKAASTAPLATDPAIVVALSPNGVNPNGPTNMANSAPVTIANNQTAIPVNANLAQVGGAAITLGRQAPANSLPVTLTVQTYHSVPQSCTASVLVGGGSGATGDWLDGVLIIPGNTSPGQVNVVDGSTGIIIFPGGANSVSTLIPFYVPIAAVSVSGAWKITTGSNVAVFATGNFT